MVMVKKPTLTVSRKQEKKTISLVSTVVLLTHPNTCSSVAMSPYFLFLLLTDNSHNSNKRSLSLERKHMSCLGICWNNWCRERLFSSGLIIFWSIWIRANCSGVFFKSVLLFFNIDFRFQYQIQKVFVSSFGLLKNSGKNAYPENISILVSHRWSHRT